MAGLKKLRNRIDSIQSTRKITKAMHVVSAAKLSKVKSQAESINLYSKVLENIAQNISIVRNSMDLSIQESLFFTKKLEDIPYLLVVMTSERGLCGGFNSSIIRKVKEDVRTFQKEGKKVKLLVIGKKGKEALNGDYKQLVERYYPNITNDIRYVSYEIRNKIIDMIEVGEFGTCYIYYNQFKNAINRVLRREKILPISNNNINLSKSTVLKYEYEGANIAHNIINLYIAGKINYGLLQNKASEEGARMTTMDNATRNAGELIKKLRLQLNRSRQTMITTQLTEIISGFEFA